MIHKYIFNIKLLLVFLFMSTAITQILAQTTSSQISGVVRDQFDRPISGAIVSAGDGKYASVTQSDGSYKIDVSGDKNILVVSFIGFADKKVEIGGSSTIDVKLEPDVHHLDEVIQLGYTSQKRRDISGSVATISGAELERSPVANLSQSFAGRLPGLGTQETYSELSRTVTDLHVRGLNAARGSSPAVMVDGIICAYKSEQTLEYISASEIESITILKDASTQALYGIQGANGLIVITTKKGKKGGLQIRTRFDESLQQVTTTPAFYNSADYAAMRNQAAYNDGLGQNYLFSQDEITSYGAGGDKNLYPSNNWYNKFFKDFASMQRVGVNLSGGNDKVLFFSNLNVMHQGGQFNTDQSKYDTNPNNIWINYRSNVDMKVTRHLDAYVHLSGNIKRERTPGNSVNDLYSSLFNAPPTMYGPTTPDVLDTDGKVITKGGKVVTTERIANPTYGMLNRSGYIRHTVTNINSQFGANLDMSFLTPGLKAYGVLAYQTNSVGHLSTTQDYERWMRTDDMQSLTFIKKGANNDTPLAYGKSSEYYYNLTYKAGMNYTRNFGKHEITGMGYLFYQNLTKDVVSSPWSLPYNRFSSGLEATYGYDNRYLVKVDFGYSGSEQYARDRRYTSTPSVSGAWVASNEAFLKQIDGLSNLKFRASYGKAANDQSNLNRYAYLDNVTVTGGGPIGSLQYNVNELQVGNPFIAAEVSTKQNYGVDLGLFKSLTVSFDYFKERMDNMVVSAVATIPTYQGIPLSAYPNINDGKFENKGYEIVANYTKAISKDLSVSLGGWYAFTKNKIISWNEAARTSDYAYTKWQEGYSYGQSFGYLVDYSNGNGFFNSQQEIVNSGLKYNIGTPRIGDLIYKDLNKDGQIDDRDKAPLGTGSIPRVTYAFSAGITYKSFDFNALFQGVGQYSSIYNGIGVWETSNDGVFGTLHKDAWTAERYQNGAKITAPALSLSKSVSQEANDYYLYNRSYLRLKNLEIGYTLPSRLCKAISAEKVRIILSGQNLITWDKMKSKDFGPEGSYSAIPVYRVYNVGVSVDF